MSQTDGFQTRHQTAQISSSYYKSLCQELAAKGRTTPQHAEKTVKSKNSVLKKWQGLAEPILLSFTHGGTWPTKLT